ncbi:unnamed protein product [Vicia faba]|uniref:GRAM domain-containing protein n=1 Tax=Vicia faba TaxID=3906 RepID=A0AAV1AVC5_VICFA|nr:unnamed protein product [Vicia faba]
MDEPPSVLEVEVCDFDGPFGEPQSLGHAEINFLKTNISDLADLWVSLEGKLALACHTKVHLRIFLDNTRGGNVVKHYISKMEKEVGKKISLRSPQTNSAFQKLFGLPPEEFLINDFTCHLKIKMPLQGRIFVSARIMGFHANLFRHKTKFFLPWEDIEDIQGEAWMQNTVQKRKMNKADSSSISNLFVSFNVANRTIMALWKARSLSIEQKVQLVEDDPENESVTSEESVTLIGSGDVTMSEVQCCSLQVPVSWTVGSWKNLVVLVILIPLGYPRTTMSMKGRPNSSFAFPDGLLINGQAHTTINGDQGKTYMIRISNVGMSTSINFRIQGHALKLVEVEGSHVIQNMYDSLDVHVGQSAAVLVTLNQSPKDYYIVASTRFSRRILTATAVLHYTNSHSPASGPLPTPPAYQYHWSLIQARSFRWNLTANAARPNPQGSYHYGKITPTMTIILANSAPFINGKQRYAVNKVSYVNPDTPLKLADYFNIPGIFSVNSIQSLPSNAPASVATSVLPTSLHDFIELVFQNNENSMQSWHLDGYDFWVVGYGFGQWIPAKRRNYNLVDALTRHTVQGRQRQPMKVLRPVARGNKEA